MNEGRLTDKELKVMLKEGGLEQPSNQFSVQLTHSILHKFAKHQIEESNVDQWLGRLILTLLVSFNILFLFYLIQLSIQPTMTDALVAFIVGLWGLLGLMKKWHADHIDSIIKPDLTHSGTK